MSSDNAISTAAQWFARHSHSPFATALLLGGGMYGLTRMAWGPTVEVLRSLGRPLGRHLLGAGRDPQSQAAANEAWDEAMDNAKKDSSLSRWVPAIMGSIAGASLLGLHDTPGAKWRGWFDWHPDSAAKALPDWLKKRGSLDVPYNHVQDFGMNSYVTELDWNRRIPASDVIGLFKNDPHLADETYARNMGISIVADAALNQHTRKPTLGGIFDSAVNKIENKLTFGGLTNVALKTAVANGVSRLFASSLGAMCDLPPQAQQKLVDAGTWAGAITSMLQ